MSQPIRACGGHLGFPIDSKNTKLVEGIEDLLPVRFGEIPCSSFRGEVENVSANQSLWRPSLISDWLKNTNFVEGIEDLLPVRFGEIPCNGFRGEVENVSANHIPRVAILDFR